MVRKTTRNLAKEKKQRRSPPDWARVLRSNFAGFRVVSRTMSCGRCPKCSCLWVHIRGSSGTAWDSLDPRHGALAQAQPVSSMYTTSDAVRASTTSVTTVTA